jgi:hypothetical protein
MIRHIGLFTLKPFTTLDQVRPWVDAIKAMPSPGLIEHTWGLDLGLREGNATMAAVFDFVDEAAYRAWDTDAEHNRIRRELMQPLLVRAERCQYRLEE